jgi:spermidine/putrescine transport system ATP-binding protein
VAIQSLEKRYGERHVLRSLSLTLAEGEFFTLLGPSGCGKTTTLRLVAGLETPSAGKIFVGGQDVTYLPAHKRPVNTVFQTYALFPHLTVADNVAFGLKERRTPRRERKRRVERMLDLVHLGARASSKPRTLSGGQQQRVALARALVLEPQVLLLDEPLGALDLQLRREMQAALRAIHDETGTTFLYVTHDQEEAFAMSDRVGVMAHGELQQVSAPIEVYRRPATEFVATFVGGSNRIPATITRAEGGGRYELRNDESDLALRGRGAYDWAVGTRVIALVRPENVKLHAAPDSDTRNVNATTARVTAVHHLGPTIRHELVTPSQQHIRADSHERAEEWQPGAMVTALWGEDDVWLLPPDSAHRATITPS